MIICIFFDNVKVAGYGKSTEIIDKESLRELSCISLIDIKVIVYFFPIIEFEIEYESVSLLNILLFNFIPSLYILKPFIWMLLPSLFQSWNDQDNIIKDELTDNNLILLRGEGAETQSTLIKDFFHFFQLH